MQSGSGQNAAGQFDLDRMFLTEIAEVRIAFEQDRPGAETVRLIFFLRMLLKLAKRRRHQTFPAAYGRGQARHDVIPAKVRHQHAEDRKSVVTGKSVSVRVDLGGRRSLKKKNQTTK